MRQEYFRQNCFSSHRECRVPRFYDFLLIEVVAIRFSATNLNTGYRVTSTFSTLSFIVRILTPPVTSRFFVQWIRITMESRNRDTDASEPIFGSVGNLVDEVSQPSKAEMQASALKHFNFFLGNSEIPFSNHTEIGYDDLTDDLFGKLANYLACHARLYCRPRGELLACSSAEHYLSAVKNYYCRAFKDRPTPNILQKDKFCIYLKALHKTKVLQARVGGKVSSYKL